MKKIALITIVLGLAGGLLLGGVLRESAPTPAGAVGAAPLDQLGSGFAVGDTTALIRRFQDALSVRRDDATSLTGLGLAYHQRYRETADPTYLTKATGVLRQAQTVVPDDPTAVAGLAGIALSQHRFGEALVLAERARKLAPESAAPYGPLGDALVELGRYDRAFAAFDRMVTLRPSLSSYARIAYARELLGRPREAQDAMSLALDAAVGRPEPTAWTLVELGKLQFTTGRTEAARQTFQSALAVKPGYVYALDWLARTEAARGRYGRAIVLAERAVDAIPLPQFVATLADIYRAKGDLANAREQSALMGTIGRLLAANGVVSDLELALFRVDHGIRLRETMALAREARAGRPSIFADDVLAWALARNGRCGEALVYSKRSLRLGTKDASFYFHRAMIERCLGRQESARAWFTRALETNPTFSLVWAATARRYAS